MKPKLLIPALAAIAATSGAFYSLQAQDAPRSKNAQRQQLQDQALIQDEDDDAESAPAPRRNERYEFRNDGNGFRFFRNGKEVKPGDDSGDSNDPAEQLRKRMEELMRERMGGGSGDNDPMEELFKRFRGQNPRGGNNQLPDFNRLFQHPGRIAGSEESDFRYSKVHRSSLSEWRPLAKAARESTVRIMRNNKQVAFGTIVSADGYALTKASEVDKDGLECEFHDGRIVNAKVVDKMESYDLALIKLDASGLTPATFSGNEAAVGTLVAAVGVDEDPIAVGIISVAARSLSEKGKGALGIRFAGAGEAPTPKKGVAVAKVFPGSPAADAGLKDGDVILSVNGTEVDYSAQLLKLIAGMRPGDRVKVRYSRDAKEGDLEFSLTSREELARISGMGDRRMLDPTAQMGSVLSGNATGYPNAVQSDLTIDSNDCGGPVVDVDGHVIAINIARSERVSTYMIPGKVVQSLLSNLATGKFTLAKDADTLTGELRDYEIAIRKAQEAMKAAEAGRAAAEEALKKQQRR